MTKTQKKTFNQTCHGAHILNEEKMGLGAIRVTCARDGRKAIIEISKSGQMIRGEYLGEA